MEGVLSGAVSVDRGGCQLEALKCAKTGCTADECSSLQTECENSEVEHRIVGSLEQHVTCAEVSHALTRRGEWHDKNQTSISEPALKSVLSLSRKEKRKNLKKLRRKQIRQEAAEKERLQQLARSQDPAEQLKIQEDEKLEAEQLENERLEHEKQERLFQEHEKKAQEEFERRQAELLEKEQERNAQEDGEENWRYVEDDGPAEIIWQGNEIIVRKKRVKVPAELAELRLTKDCLLQNADLSTSNPLPPQSTAFAAHKFPPPSTPDAAEQNPIFGTEQDKTHCPFHIKTGVCRFGTRCSRVHVYPDQSFTLLVRNMYTGPGLSWDHDEGLEVLQSLAFTSASEEGRKFFWRPDEGKAISAYHSDEEIAEQFEEFYEDVHSEFLQFGELVNFKVCKNGSSHLRGNVYVHYQTEAGAQAAYNALNGRFYAGKQITCEFVGVTRWRVALCGEYMKGHHRPCSHGSACNFLHCFGNPRGEYDWADWDSPPPRYWVVKMAKLFGYERDHREDYDSYYDDPRKSDRSSKKDRNSERGHGSKDRYSNSRVDASEHPTRHRERRRHRSRDNSYQSSSDDLESTSRRKTRSGHQRSSHGSVGEANRSRTSGGFQEKGRRYHRNSVYYDVDTSQDKRAPRDSDGLDYTDKELKYGRDHEVDGHDADEHFRQSHRKRKRCTTPEHESSHRLPTKSRSRDVQIHDYRLSNGHKGMKDRCSSGSPGKNDETAKRASETEDESERKSRKREPANRGRSKSRRGSERHSRRLEGDSSDAEIDKNEKNSRSEHKRRQPDGKMILRCEKPRHDSADDEILQSDRWRPDVDIYQ